MAAGGSLDGCDCLQTRFRNTYFYVAQETFVLNVENALQIGMNTKHLPENTAQNGKAGQPATMKENSTAPRTPPEYPVRLLTIHEAAEVLRIPISWLYERTRRNAIPFRRIGKYVRFTQEDLSQIISSSEEPKNTAADRS